MESSRVPLQLLTLQCSSEPQKISLLEYHVKQQYTILMSALYVMFSAFVRTTAGSLGSRYEVASDVSSGYVRSSIR